MMGIDEVLAVAFGFVFYLLPPVMLVARLIGAIFTADSRNRLTEHPFIHVGWFIYTIVVLYLCIGIPLLMIRARDQRLSGKERDQLESSNMQVDHISNSANAV
jgi:undecaprenyl pyrophosphate phosphatase UppP